LNIGFRGSQCIVLDENQYKKAFSPTDTDARIARNMSSYFFDPHHLSLCARRDRRGISGPTDHYISNVLDGFTEETLNEAPDIVQPGLSGFVMLEDKRSQTVKTDAAKAQIIAQVEGQLKRVQTLPAETRSQLPYQGTQVFKHITKLAGEADWADRHQGAFLFLFLLTLLSFVLFRCFRFVLN
jgi:hypothetical protein